MAAFLWIVVGAIVLLMGFDRIAGRSQSVAAKKIGDAVRSKDVDVADQIERLSALRDAGDLSDDEFQAEKRRLLGRR